MNDEMNMAIRKIEYLDVTLVFCDIVNKTDSYDYRIVKRYRRYRGTKTLSVAIWTYLSDLLFYRVESVVFRYIVMNDSSRAELHCHVNICHIEEDCILSKKITGKEFTFMIIYELLPGLTAPVFGQSYHISPNRARIYPKHRCTVTS